MRLASFIFGLTLAAAAVAPASAALVTGSFGGQIDSGTDTSGYFTGLAGADLSGAAISGTFQYDTDLAPNVGGGNFGGDGLVNWLGFTITIAGQGYSFGTAPLGGDTFHTGFVGDGFDELNLSLSRGDSLGAESFGLDLSGSDFLSGSSLPSSFTFAGAGFGSFVIQTDAAIADGFFTISSAQTDPVPEPQVWATLLAGFGMLGAALRFRPGGRRRTHLA